MKKNIILFFLLLSHFLLAQKTVNGDFQYEKLAYIDAIKIYEGVASKGYKSKEIFEKLGNAYYFNGMLDKSKFWYDQLFDIYIDIDPEYYFRYAQSLKSVKDYKNADKMMQRFYELTNDYRGEMYVKNKLYLTEMNQNEVLFKVEDAGVNSPVSDYGPYFYKNKMYFVSSRKFSKLKNKTDRWTNQNYANLMIAEFNDKTNPVYIEEISGDINTKFHESTLVFSKDGNTIYFTRNNFNKGKLGFNDKKEVLLKIFKATLINNKWTNIIELPFNSDKYSCAHPALSSDEKTLYFSSDMPGGFGGSDLYKVVINDDGTFGKPINLGPKINTKSRETFPYINKEGNLYFASDGHLGLGGLDIFKSKVGQSGEFTNFENLGVPINSEKDDFAFVDSPFDKVFFFSSNREGGKGFDDIYKAIELDKPEELVIEDVVVDAITKEEIPNAKISVFDANYNLITEFTTNDIGQFTIGKLRKDRDYIVKIESENYFTQEKRYKSSEPIQKNIIFLSPKFLGVDPGDDLQKILGINIYFDLDQYFIRPDAEVELAKLIEVLQKYPQIKIHIKSHTDSRQSKAYNLRLSNFRANATRDYIIKKGISKNRITAKGYGESELINECSDGVPCSRSQHQANRRSEFIVLDN